MPCVTPEKVKMRHCNVCSTRLGPIRIGRNPSVYRGELWLAEFCRYRVWQHCIDVERSVRNRLGLVKWPGPSVDSLALSDSANSYLPTNDTGY